MATESQILEAKKELARRELARREAAAAAPPQMSPRERLAQSLARVQENFDTGIDVAKTFGSPILAEPIAGLAGIATQNILNPIPSPQERAENVAATREALTYEPQTPEGQELASGVSERLKPFMDLVNSIRQKTGDYVYDKTGSPLAAGIASAAPDAAAEALGIGAGYRIGKAAARMRDAPGEIEVSKTLKEAAPTQQQLREQSTRHFTEIDDMGVTINNSEFSSLVERAEAAMKAKGGSPRVTAEAWGALEEMRDTLKKLDEGEPIPLSELEELREIANVAADTPTQPKKQAVALAVVDEIDDFIESATPKQFNMPEGVNPNEVGVKYRQARQQWGRYRRSQMLDKALDAATRQASGFENGVAIQFRQILNNPRKKKFFKPEELAAMSDVVERKSGAGIARALGKLGVDFGGGNNALLAFLTGVGTYGVTENVFAALSIVGASSTARKLAERLTLRNAKFADQLIRAGVDGRKITQAYMMNTPKNMRSADELSLLLMNENIDLSGVARSDLEKAAANLALERRAELAGAMSSGTATGNTQQQRKPPPQLQLVAP